MKPPTIRGSAAAWEATNPCPILLPLFGCHLSRPQSIPSGREGGILLHARPNRKPLSASFVSETAPRDKSRQAEFSRRYAASPRSLQERGQGRRPPDSAVRAYLTVIDRNPEAVEKALMNKAWETRGIRHEKPHGQKNAHRYPLRKGQERVDIILTKFQDTGLALPKNLFDICRGAIATADPYDLGWKPENETSLMKIGILRHDDEVVITGKFPNHCVICVPQTQQPHARRTGVDSLKCLHQARR